MQFLTRALPCRCRARRVARLVVITPWVDELAEDHALAHFAQHGSTFVGAVTIGMALRDPLSASPRA